MAKKKNISEAMSALGKARWAKVPKKDRKVHGKWLADQRWHKNK